MAEAVRAVGVLLALADRSSQISPALVGADSNEDERQKLLGQKFVLVVIDEAQAFGIDLRQLVYGVLKPAVADYRGTIILTGTPGNLIKRLFFDLITGKEAGWSATAGTPTPTRTWRSSGPRRSRT